MTESPKMLFIDWFGTLSTSYFWEHLKQKDQDTYLQIQKALFDGPLSPMLNAWMRGQLITEDVIGELAYFTGLESHKLYLELVYSCKTMTLTSPSVLTLVDKIRQGGTSVAIATDNMDTFSRWTVPILNLDQHFDAILNSSALGFRKSDFKSNGTSLFFDPFLQQHGLLPSECIIIDDSEDKDSLLTRYGINYHRITFGKGILPELVKILHELSST